MPLSDTPTPQHKNTFFIGRDVKGRVKKAESQTFSEFVESFLAKPITLPLTRGTYFSLPKVERDAAKSTSYFTATQFATSPSPRQDVYATSCSLIALDVDEAEPAQSILSSLADVKAKMDGLNFAIYHTTSSTPELPRIRIVVEADSIPLEQHPRAVWTIQYLLRLPVIDRASERISQPMFLPTAFQDDRANAHPHPLIAFATNGRPFTVADIDPDAPRPRPHTTKTRVHASNDSDELDALDHLRNPVDGITMEGVKELLSFIDPDCEYDQWTKVLAAIKHQFPHPADADEAFNLFNAWSEQGQKYTSYEDTYQKWQSFEANPTTRNPVTLRTLIKMAKDAGYQAAEPAPCTSEAEAPVTLAQKQSTATSAPALISVTLDHLAQLNPQPSNADQAIVLSELARALKTLYKVTITPAALRRDLKAKQMANNAQQYAVQRANAVAENDGEFPVPDWVAPFVYLSNQAKFFDTSLKLPYSREAFDVTFASELTPTADQVDDPAQLSRPRTMPSAYAANEIRIPKVFDLQYAPEYADQVIVEYEGVQYANSYRKDYTPANPTTSEAEGALFRKHLEVLIEDKEHQDFILDVAAHLVQNPGVKPNFAVVIQGPPGCGKTQLTRMIGLPLGASNRRVVSPAELATPYNSYAVGKMLVVLEEVRVTGKGKSDTMAKIIPLITNPRFTRNEKNEKGCDDANKGFYIALSNHKDCLALTPDDRRFFVLESRLQTRESVLAVFETGHYAEVEKMLEADTGGLRHYLLNHRISSSFNYSGHAPRTKYFNNMLTSSSNEHALNFRDIIADDEAAVPLVKHDLVAVSHLIDALLKCPGVGTYTHFSAKFIANLLSEEGYEKLGRHQVCGNQLSLWVKCGTAKAQDWKKVAEQRIAAAQDSEIRDHFNEPSEFKEQSDFDTKPSRTQTLQQEIDELL